MKESLHPSRKKLRFGVFLVLAGATTALIVVNFGRTAYEGEWRYRCFPLCMLQPDYTGRNRIAPDFSLPDLEGGSVQLSELFGKVIILHFWTETCAPCLKELPELAALSNTLSSRPDVVVLTVSIDPNQAKTQDTLELIVGAPIPFRTLLDPESKVVSQLYGISLFPETWIIDKQGVVRARFDGVRPWNHALMIELIDHLRDGRFCPIESKTKQEGENACSRLIDS
ncbi:TlpA family protein disulfide reductase [Pajaroellobacter abortibovis]|uniref:Thioredoxin domain-containing protein n=1 Tax=Pajaroellobacter abortibovis TaxID=1882918 RepID=A0A1L6MUY0_9BACT|nr:TlpA disulfide reductase family protein [Pajaroellobacter abortibovis]APR99322.1 hypothetical protein BCY86_00500 [Pajaroellobacter abortibovis]